MAIYILSEFNYFFEKICLSFESYLVYIFESRSDFVCQNSSNFMQIHEIFIRNLLNTHTLDEFKILL